MRKLQKLQKLFWLLLTNIENDIVVQIIYSFSANMYKPKIILKILKKNMKSMYYITLFSWVSTSRKQGRSQDFSKAGGGSQCVTSRVLTTLSCQLNTFIRKKISTVNFLTVVFGAKKWKFFKFAPFRHLYVVCCSLKKISQRRGGGGHGHPRTPSLCPWGSLFWVSHNWLYQQGYWLGPSFF